MRQLWNPGAETSGYSRSLFLESLTSRPVSPGVQTISCHWPTQPEAFSLRISQILRIALLLLPLFYSLTQNDSQQILLGGISTAAGGDVNITAGQNVISYSPAGIYGDAGTGAFGADHGSVTISGLHGDVVGHYVARNGVGTITAGKNAGGEPDASSPPAGKHTC